MSKNTPRQRVEQLKGWLSWITVIAKRNKK
jgi:hypothetical protein